jgi:enamine deaminase RidA (YjgF/YER057c/UK114 family)
MPHTVPISPTRLGGSGVLYGQGVKAGSWLFFTGHEANDFEHGLMPFVRGKPGLPLAGQPRYRREGDFLFQRFARLLAENGSDLRNIVRIDQFYPAAECVNPYQRSRKAVLGAYVPPSTSVLMEELTTEGAGMNVSLVAVASGGAWTPKAAESQGVPVPQHSGFIASLVYGDYVFVAGQMPNNEAMTGLHPNAYRPPSALWNGTEIRLQTDFLITDRLRPALAAGGSSLSNAVAAHVYLTDVNDLPEFLDVWQTHFGRNPCALTVVPTKGLALKEAKVEINMVGLREAGATKKQIIEHAASEAMRLGPAAVRAGDLLCLSGLVAADEDGAIASVRSSAGLRHLGVPAQNQMRAILTAADGICKKGGTSLLNVVRAQHFLADFGSLYPSLHVWREMLGDVPLPLGAVRYPRPVPVPGCDIAVDVWAYCPT